MIATAAGFEFVLPPQSEGGAPAVVDDGVATGDGFRLALGGDLAGAARLIHVRKIVKLLGAK